MFPEFAGTTVLPRDIDALKTLLEAQKTACEQVCQTAYQAAVQTLRREAQDYVIRMIEQAVLARHRLFGATDTIESGGRLYVVQTTSTVIQRCLLMVTDSGDLVFDPSCGSGTTAFVAEKWGRRWVTCDTSRVPLALARQRLLTAIFPYYELKDAQTGPQGGFVF